MVSIAALRPRAAITVSRCYNRSDETRTGDLRTSAGFERRRAPVQNEEAGPYRAGPAVILPTQP